MSFGLGWTGGSGGAAAGGEAVAKWTRPADWPAMPTTVVENIDILAAVTNDSSNFVAVKAAATGGYTVDWGDGVIENVASGVQRDHQYTFATLGTAETSRGYKTALVKIYPQTASPITSFDLGLKNVTPGLTPYINPWLDIQVNTPSCTAMTFRTLVECRWVERINIIAIGAITTMAAMFQSCNALQEITFPAGSLASVTTLASCFNTCSSLLSVTFPAGSLTVGMTSLASAFTVCSSLQSVSFPAGSLTGVTTMLSAFSACPSLRAIEFPAGSLAAVTSLGSTFTGCQSLKSVVFPAGSLVASPLVMSSTFQNCVALQSVVFPVGSLTGVTLLDNVFNADTGLQYVAFPTGSLANVTTIAGLFTSCQGMQSVSFPAGSFASLVTTTNAFSSCTSLEKIANCEIPVSFTLACNMSAAELDALYTSLPSVTAKTLTVSTNYGYAASTQSIATGKGWTLA